MLKFALNCKKVEPVAPRKDSTRRYLCDERISPTNRIFLEENMIIYNKNPILHSEHSQQSGDSGFESRAAFLLSCWPNGKAPDYEDLHT